MPLTKQIIVAVFSVTIMTATKYEQLPVEVIFFSDPTSMPISSDSQQVE